MSYLLQCVGFDTNCDAHFMFTYIDINNKVLILITNQFCRNPNLVVVKNLEENLLATQSCAHPKQALLNSALTRI